MTGRLLCILALGFMLLAAPAASAAPFDCPWTPVSGPNPGTGTPPPP